MKFVIDRFEGEFAVIEDENKNFHHISKSALSGFAEGDVFVISKNEGENESRKKRIENLAEELFI